ncbi:hypothetical protein [Nocardioides sp.]|uniref:hypothetical protein n=1 Tax=Nocardioides sp. TaxID=35761 RepID=UPI0039E61841
MMQTLPVRRTDPVTSKQVAASAGPISRRPRVRDAVLVALQTQGPMTHDDLIRFLADRHSETPAIWPAASPSSVRTRCNELARDGQVEPVPDAVGKSTYGNTALLWRAVTVQGK